MRTRILATLLALVLWAVLAGSAASASDAAGIPGTGWRISAASFPAALAPSGTGMLSIAPVNTGAVDAQGLITVVDELPAGVTATGYAGVASGQLAGFGPAWDCKGNAGSPGEDLLVGATVVECVADPENGALFPGGQGISDGASGGSDGASGVTGESEKGAIAPPIAIGIEAPNSEGTLENRVTVFGGGGSPASTTDPVEVSTSPSVFQVNDWDASFSDADGSVDLQAGSHPYMWTSSFDLSTMTTALGNELLIAGGQPRNAFVELPPGLIGNPQAISRCTRQQFDKLQCPAASKIGLGHAIFARFQSPLVPFSQGPGKALTIFNMVPPPGSPAEIAFEINGFQSSLTPRCGLGPTTVSTSWRRIRRSVKSSGSN